MSVSKERTVSLWMNTEVAPQAAPLRRDDTTDVVVVGSGIAGLSTAYELARRGQDVIVIDRGPIGKGMTSRTTAHLVAICDDSFDSFIKLRGLDAAKAYYESQSAAVDRIEQIQSEEHIACNFRRVTAFYFLPLEATRRSSMRNSTRRDGSVWRSKTRVAFLSRDKSRRVVCDTPTRAPSIRSSICAV